MDLKPRALTTTELLAGFGVKVIMGILYGYLFLHYYDGDDTWKFFRESLKETQLLLNDPVAFFKNEYTPLHAFRQADNWIEIIKVYLNDLEYALLVKTMAFMNLLSKGNYYVNVVFFNMIFFFGHYWLFRLMNGLFPSKRKLFFTAIFFFLPAVFWLSGIRIEGFVFFFVSLLLYNFCRVGGSGSWRTIWIIIGFLGVLICRPQFAMLLAVGMTAYMVTRKVQQNPWIVFGGVYTFAIILFFASARLLPDGGLPGIVVEKQYEYLNLKGTRLQLDSLHGSPSGFIKVFPQAALNTFVRPFPWESKGLLQLMASAEVVAFWLIILGAIIRHHEFWKLRLLHPVILFILFLGISSYISIGYIVPFPGAIVRYKAIAEILLICCAISISSWGEKSNYRNL